MTGLIEPGYAFSFLAGVIATIGVMLAGRAIRIGLKEEAKLRKRKGD